MKKLVLLLALVACSDRKSPPTASVSSTTQHKPGATLTDKAQHLIVGVVDDWTTTRAMLRLYNRTDRGWEQDGSSWPAVVGRSGTAWGIGLHGETPPREGPVKKEGDGKAPAGIFALRTVYGLAPEAPHGLKLPYETTAQGDWQCVDDPASEHYDEIIDRKQVAADWESAEELLRDDELYTWVVDVAHNPKRTKAKGSCIFLHVWGGPNVPTSGCTAMEKVRLLSLLESLDPTTLYVLLPKADYEALAGPWGLPPL